MVWVYLLKQKRNSLKSLVVVKEEKLTLGALDLGCYLAQQIARAHKGDVLIDSEGLGKGSTFSVSHFLQQVPILIETYLSSISVAVCSTV